MNFLKTLMIKNKNLSKFREILSSLQGNITQTITSFNKNNLGTTNGNITLN